MTGIPFASSSYSRWHMPGCYLFLGYKWTDPLGSDMEVRFNTNIDSKKSGNNFYSNLCQRGKMQLKS